MFERLGQSKITIRQTDFEELLSIRHTQHSGLIAVWLGSNAVFPSSTLSLKLQMELNKFIIK